MGLSALISSLSLKVVVVLSVVFEPMYLTKRVSGSPPVVLTA